jgi:SAM-dependent methyltransferase
MAAVAITIVPVRPAPPYSRLARAYDAAIGGPSFCRTRSAFERIVRDYHLRFRSAADLGCGTGLFACYLARVWCVPVIAVDRSAEMLQIAARRCRGHRVCLLQQDLRELELPAPVDLATANFDTLNHLSCVADLRLALHRVAANLVRGGHFIFDVITPCRPLGGRLVRSVRTASRRVTQIIRWDPDRRRLAVAVVIKRSGAPCATLEVHRERVFDPAEIHGALADARFIVRGIHDAVTLRDDEPCPARIVVVAEKR